MRIVIEIPDETFDGYPKARIRVARYVRIVADQLAECEENSGIASLTPSHLGIGIHSAGWAVEGAPWQQPVEGAVVTAPERLVGRFYEGDRVRHRKSNRTGQVYAVSRHGKGRKYLLVNWDDEPRSANLWTWWPPTSFALLSRADNEEKP